MRNFVVHFFHFLSSVSIYMDDIKRMLVHMHMDFLFDLSTGKVHHAPYTMFPFGRNVYVIRSPVCVQVHQHGWYRLKDLAFLSIWSIACTGCTVHLPGQKSKQHFCTVITCPTHTSILLQFLTEFYTAKKFSCLHPIYCGGFFFRLSNETSDTDFHCQ